MFNFVIAMNLPLASSLEISGEKMNGSRGWYLQGTGRGQVTLQETQGERSPLSDVFSTLVRADTMQNGRSRSVSMESFLVLLLEIRGCSTLEEAIQAFTKEERIDDQVSKKSSFVRLPRSLIIGLNRFGFDMYTVEPVKIGDVLHYPEVLTMEAGQRGTSSARLLSTRGRHRRVGTMCVGRAYSTGHGCCSTTITCRR